jgi:hypothetical protein
MKLPEVYGATYGAIPTEKGSGLYAQTFSAQVAPNMAPRTSGKWCQATVSAGPGSGSGG